MASRDASRIKIKFPDMDYDGTGAVDTASSFYPCIFEGPNWSGFNKPGFEVTCNTDTLDAWGNLVRAYRTGTVIDYGTITIGVDWDITDIDGGKVFGAFASTITGDFIIEIPANVGETTGPKITFPGVVESFTPQGTILGTENEARFAAQVVIRIAGTLTFTAPV